MYYERLWDLHFAISKLVNLRKEGKEKEEEEEEHEEEQEEVVFEVPLLVTISGVKWDVSFFFRFYVTLSIEDAIISSWLTTIYCAATCS